jgi:hypothetical protein
MIAVSKGSDPAGAYYVYEFVMPNVRLNDYAKLAVWNDAYYMSTDEFLGSDYVGSGAFAFDKTKLIKGDPSASYIYFHLAQPPPDRIGGILPSDLDGLSPAPSGAPNTFVGYSATEYGDSIDGIRLFDFHADFADPLKSTFTERPESPLRVAAFDPTSPGGRADIAQPAPGERLDSISDRLMNRISYRNFGDHESLVFNQTVRSSATTEEYRAGVRIYELRRPSGSMFVVSEQSTVGDNSSSRWLGSAAQDNQGNIAVAYSFVSDKKKPSILYSGRLAGDPAGTIREEAELVAGTGVQKAFGFRWGDYSSLTVDPTDDCSMWATNEYFTQESEDFSDFAWLTRIGAFKFPECIPAPRSTITGHITDVLSGLPVSGAQVRASQYSRVSEADGSYGPMMVLPGTYSLTVSAPGYRERSIAIIVSDRQTSQLDMALEPIPVIENVSMAVSDESCSINHAAEPGETVTVDLALRNTGHIATGDLTVSLSATDEIISPSSAQHYGLLPADGSPVSRRFTFTISRDVNCGTKLRLLFSLIDGINPLNPLDVTLRAGAINFALKEQFDIGGRARLPAKWSSTATGAQQPWTRSGVRSDSLPYSIFSPDPNQIGVNELISPPVLIRTSDASLKFRNWYDLETTFLRNRLYDGSVLEISLDGGVWQDILAAGGSFETGGYDGVIDSCCQNPLAGHMGWSGRSGPNQSAEFIDSSVRLPPAAAGHEVRFRWRVGTDVGTFRQGQYIDDVEVSDGYSCTCAISSVHTTPFDLDADGKTDLSVFRPNNDGISPDFFVLNSATDSLAERSWGNSGDIAAVADYDGDGKADYAVYRPLAGVWYVLRSSDSAAVVNAFGSQGDIPIPTDHDGDGKADIGVFRPGNSTWYWQRSTNGQVIEKQFGTTGDIPVVGDVDGDGRADAVVYRPVSGTWFAELTSNGTVTETRFGLSGDMPAAGDFDGDGITDLTVFRPAEGTWYLFRSRDGFGAVQFGQNGDTPINADFDGDGRADISVYRPGSAVWYFIRSSDLQVLSRQFGLPGDRPVPTFLNGP